MSDSLVVIYTAPTVQQAHLLKNLLDTNGIQAMVTNDILETGLNTRDWSMQPRVRVDQADAEMARQIAVMFNETVSAEPELAEQAEASVAGGGIDGDIDGNDDFWPRCPECDARRPTRCSICQTTGTDFPISDPSYLAVSHLAEDAEPSGCHCGTGGCASDDQQASGTQQAESDEALDDREPPPELMVICTTCDEPFVPEYPRQCEWCGHEFEAGYEIDTREPLLEPIPFRALAVICGLLALGASAFVYFFIIL